jgi:hypothetical protein
MSAGEYSNIFEWDQENWQWTTGGYKIACCGNKNRLHHVINSNEPCAVSIFVFSIRDYQKMAEIVGIE